MMKRGIASSNPSAVSSELDTSSNALTSVRNPPLCVKQHAEEPRTAACVVLGTCGPVIIPAGRPSI